MWLGEQITAKGVGNGISVLILQELYQGSQQRLTKFTSNSLKMLAISYFYASLQYC